MSRTECHNVPIPQPAVTLAACGDQRVRAWRGAAVRLGLLPLTTVPSFPKNLNPLDSPRQQLDAPPHGVSLDRLDRNSTRTRQARQGSTGKASTTASTAARRSLDSSTARQRQGSTKNPSLSKRAALPRGICSVDKTAYSAWAYLYLGGPRLPQSPYRSLCQLLNNLTHSYVTHISPI